jgi:hypothetical protein
VTSSTGLTGWIKTCGEVCQEKRRERGKRTRNFFLWMSCETVARKTFKVSAMASSRDEYTPLSTATNSPSLQSISPTNRIT